MSRLDIDSIAGKIAKEILSEQQSEEEERQDAIASEIDKNNLKAKKSKEDPDGRRLTDEAEDEDEDEDKEEPEADIKPKPKPNEDKDKDDKEGFEVKSDEEIPDTIDFDGVKKQINNLRAGGSLKDEDISGQLEDYFDKLGKADTRALYVYLSSIASILTGGTQGVDAPRPEDADVDLTMVKKKEASAEKSIPSVDGGGEQAPIIVGEIANTLSTKLMILETLTINDDHRCLDGSIVKFGSKKCRLDIQDRISDVAVQRDSCSRGTADRSSLNGMLNYLRQKLRKADKLSM
jgi:hypothetical protein